jgi:SAM-dependent methyltransferase
MKARPDPQEYWNQRYLEGWSGEPTAFLLSIADLLPTSGRALDVAGGNGRNALWLGERGLETAVVDVSDEALGIALSSAADRGVDLTCLHADLRSGSLPAGPWDLILCSHYLQRDLFPLMVGSLAEGGVLACAIATVRNLERHPRPPREFVLDEEELPSLVGDLTVIRYDEGWFGDHHEAQIVARRAAPA